MLEPGTFFEIADVELDHGMGAVEGVHAGGVSGQIGEEAVMAPLRPQTSLGRVGETGAAHDQAPTVVDALAHLGLAFEGVVDVDPVLLVDGGDGGDGRIPVRTAIV